MKKLLIKLREEWFKAVIASVVALILAGTAAFGRYLWNAFYYRAIEVRSISSDEAIRIARERIGVRALYALPFINRDDPHQYVAVFVAGAGSWARGSVELLRGTGGLYERLQMDLPAYDDRTMFEWLDKIGAREYLEPLFGVIDVEGDGKREIFSTMRNAGTGSWDLTVLVYDTSTSRSFSAGISGGRGIFTTEPEFEGSFEAKPLVKRWLAEKINSYTGRKERSSTNIEDVWDAIHDWQRNNGRDFTLGKIVTTETRLFELHWSSICEIVDGNINWLWLLDGPLLMENKATRRRSVLYVPGDGNMAYRHNVRMISGRDYLWLEFRVQDKIVAINKKQLIAKGFRVAQWKNYANKPYDKSLDEKEVTFDLGYREGHLYDGESILTILDDLDMRQEFTGAVQCPSIGENSPIVLR